MRKLKNSIPSAATPLHSLRKTADKRLRFASPKLPSATFFISKTLYEMVNRVMEIIKWNLKE